MIFHFEVLIQPPLQKCTDIGHFISRRNITKFSVVYNGACKKDLSVVGKISGVYRKTMAKTAEMAHFAIMLNVILAATSDTPSPAHKDYTNTYYVPHEWTLLCAKCLQFW